MARARPSGTPIASALAQRPGPEPLPLTDAVPCPGPRYGLGEKVRATLLAMNGDQSFTVPFGSNNTVYAEAKRAGIAIVTRREGELVRIWRVQK